MAQSESAAWDTAFANVPGTAELLGVCGSSVEQLAWRLLRGGEALGAGAAPRVTVLLIG